MFYAKFIRNATDTPTVGGIDGKPLNFYFAAFDTQAERQAGIDTAWAKGGNGFKVPRTEVVRYLGRDFEVGADGECFKAGNDWRDGVWDDAQHIARIEDKDPDVVYSQMLTEQPKPIWAA